MGVTNLLTFTERKLAEGMVPSGNHLSEKFCLGWFKVGQRLPGADTLPYIDIVEEALCFGWIDSAVKKLPDGRLAQRLSPRKKGSQPD